MDTADGRSDPSGADPGPASDDAPTPPAPRADAPPGPTFDEPDAGIPHDPDAFVVEDVPRASAGQPARAGGVDERGRLRSGRLAGLSMGTAIWTLSWPVLTEQGLNWLVGMTDTVLAARLDEGEAAADAIGLGAYVMWFLGLSIMAVGVGATTLISRSVGKGRLGVANGVMGQALAAGILFGGIVGVIVALATPGLAAMNLADGTARAHFASYMLPIALTTPIASTLFVLAAVSRGAGDSKRPLLAMGVRNAVNIVVSFLLSGVVLPLPGWLGGGELASPFRGTPLDLGVLGIALGTVLGDLAGAAIVLRFACSGKWGIRLRSRWLRPRRATLARLWRLGWPNFVETGGMWTGNYAVVTIVAALGPGVMGAHIITIRIESLSFLPGFAMGMVAATLAGQYLGAGRPDLAKRAAFRCMLITCLVMGALGLVYVWVPEAIVAKISSQAAHLALAPMPLLICGLVQIPFALALVFRQALRGAGDVRVTMAITWFTTYAVRLPLAFICAGVDLPIGPQGDPWLTIPNPAPAWLADAGIHGLTGVWFGLCLELTIRGLVFSARYLEGGWLRQRV